MERKMLFMALLYGCQIVIARSEATRQSKKIIKKILIYRLFYWIASSIAMQFPCNDGSSINVMPSETTNRKLII
ncbi:MAG TPA: hypothetical protein LFV92_03495 [Rickettsia endosymbiont of Ceroptres masudai]|nr:hypothetical protein [Rickettsia endosymbiont of Ceroptres masudai]